jgi:hypothetical protein
MSDIFIIDGCNGAGKMVKIKLLILEIFNLITAE